MTARRVPLRDASPEDGSSAARLSPAPDGPRAKDAQFDDEMTRTMRVAAEQRAERARLRAAEDDRSYRDEAAAIRALVRRSGPNEERP